MRNHVTRLVALLLAGGVAGLAIAQPASGTACYGYMIFPLEMTPELQAPTAPGEQVACEPLLEAQTLPERGPRPGQSQDHDRARSADISSVWEGTP